ncbi:hypothetical protein J4E93_003413 [Alternaria ventricosa]|uniref:uncharacterized protein n=1 Tax=Alternaria ventricosa TaxID=1187951 RepID=UPI0020C2859E|nr:uncharacterized protein J4E93_003413 [Alternaria ventricosa]KAI4649100.1 hypothetical protein J4E93_003413 [Alternaria ventricosa]
MGIKTRCIDKLEVLGRDNPTRDNQSFQLQNPFRNFSLLVRSNPLFWLGELSLVGLNLQQLPPAMYTSFNITSLRVPQLKQSIYLEKVFEYLMSSKEPLLLHTLKISIHSYKESLKPDEAFGFAAFCRSFSTLKTVEVEICADWQTNLDAHILSSHSNLEVCILSLGVPSLNMATLQVLRANHKSLKVLGFRCQQIALSLDHGRFFQEAKKRIRGLAAELSLFEKLEEWQLICQPVHTDPSPVTLVSCRTIAMEIYQKVVAVYGTRPCTINTISIFARDIYYTPDEVHAGKIPDMRRFQFWDVVA